jgi:glycosidase
VTRSASVALAILTVGVALIGVTASASTGPSLAPTAPSLDGDRIYFVMTDRYADGDPSNDTGGVTGGRNQTGYDPSSTAYFHGGDFVGLAEHLQRIKDLGFNAIWVTPAVVNEVSDGSSAGYHGYWGLDFTRVDPHLGTNDEFAAFVDKAHGLGMKVILDVVPNHTADIIQPSGGTTYSDVPYRDCHGKAFDPAKYVGKAAFPCLKATTMPRPPIVFPGETDAKAPAWLNDPTNYHNRGDIDFSSCSELCYQQGDVDGLDDLFTEKQSVVDGLARIYSSWVTTYKLDGFRVDTARHLNPGFWKLWVPKIDAAARSVGVSDFQMFGEVFIADTLEQSPYIRDTALPGALDFPFQDAATGYASGGSSALAMEHRLQDDDYYRRSDGVEPAFATFLGNHDMGRAAYEIRLQGGGLSGNALLQHLLLGYDLLYLMRGAPVVYYGDEVGMIGTGGDQAARQDMFPTQVPDWQTQERVGSPPIGTGSSFDVTNDPIEALLRQLGALRDANPALGSGWSVVRYAKGGVLVVSRIDPATRTEYLAAFNNGASAAAIRVQTATPSTTWSYLFGAAPAGVNNNVGDAKGMVSVTIPAVGAVLLKANAAIPVSTPPRPRLKVVGDPLTSMWAATATVAGLQPVSVAFLWRKASGGAQHLLDIDTSPPFRGFIEPGKFGKRERIVVTAVARSLDGRTATSKAVPFVVRSR